MNGLELQCVAAGRDGQDGPFHPHGTIGETGAEEHDALMSIARPMAARLSGEYEQHGSKLGLDRDDIVQIVLASVWQQRGAIGLDDRGVKTYIAETMRHAAVNAIRDRNALKRGGGWKRLSIDGCVAWLPDESRDEHADEVLAETIGAAMSSLSELERGYCEALKDGESHACAARQLGLTTSKSRTIRKSIYDKLCAAGIDGGWLN